jgi:hypothetical protein
MPIQGEGGLLPHFAPERREIKLGPALRRFWSVQTCGCLF